MLRTRIQTLAANLLLTAAFPRLHAQAPPSGFSTTASFDEEFNGTSLDTGKWSYRNVGQLYGNCNYVTDAVSVANGYVTLSLYSSGGNNYCGAITTSKSGGFHQKYGYWEASLRYVYQPALQTSFWIQSPTNGATIGNPQSSGVEMDVFEHTSTNTNAQGYDHAFHWNGYGDYEQSLGYSEASSILADGNFHRFGIAWTPGHYVLYVDGVSQFTLYTNDAAISDALEYLILDVEQKLASSPSNGDYGALGSSSNGQLQVDWVHVFPYASTVNSTTLSPVANAYVRDGTYAGDNFNGSTTLDVKSDASSYNRNSYLRFDLSNITGTLQKATLYMMPVSVGEANITNQATFVSNTTWDQTTITWNNQPSSTTALTQGINYNANILTNFDVSAHTPVGALYSIELVPSSPTGSPTEVEYASQQNGTAASRPVLVVVTTP